MTRALPAWILLLLPPKPLPHKPRPRMLWPCMLWPCLLWLALLPTARIAEAASPLEPLRTTGGPAAAQDWEEIVLDFQDNFAFSQPLETRLRAVELLGTVDRIEAAALLLLGLRVTQNNVEDFMIELEPITRALEPLQKQVLQPEEWEKRDRLDAERAAIGKKLDDERAIEDALIAGLARMRDEDAVSLLHDEGLHDDSFLVRAATADVLGQIGLAASIPSLIEICGDEDPRVRVAAIDSLGGFKAVEALPATIAALGDEVFAVRASAVEALGKIGGKEAIAALIIRMEHEKGRLRADIGVELRNLTKQKFRDPRAWADWWKKNESTFEATKGIRLKKAPPPPPKRDKDKPAITYHGIETTSSEIVFVLDISDSMNEAAKTRYVGTDGAVERVDSERSKFKVARDELIRTLKSLDPTDNFNIIVFNENVQKYKEKLIPALPSNIAEAIAYLRKLEASGGTNTFDSLEAAFTLGGFGVQDRFYGSKVDTIFLLSDGAPSAGRLLEPEEILAEVRRINNLRKIRIHTVAVGHLADREFLRKLAVENIGVSVDRY